MNISQQISGKTSTNKTIKSFCAESLAYQSKLDIISALYHQWNLQELKQAGIVSSFLLNWNPAYFILNSGSGSIERDGISYQCLLHNCSLQDINQVKKVALSFRHCKELDIAIVLVKFIFK